MRIVFLTTGSLRRRFVVQELQRTFDIARVFIETRNAKPPFPTAHEIDNAARDHERQIFFGGNAPPFAKLADVEQFDKLNSPDAAKAISEAKPDVLFVYGTGRILKEVIALCPEGAMNLHGGDPEAYRGLDCPLWTVYHRDFAGLVETLMRLSPEFDNGDIIAKLPVPVTPGMALHELRKSSTETVVRLLATALRDFQTHNACSSVKQRREGRYYSHMPSVMKGLCVRRFAKYTALLGQGRNASPEH